MPSVNKRSNISRSILIYIKAPLLSERHLYAVLLSGCQRGVPLPLIKLFLPMVRGLGPAPCVRARLAWPGNDDGRDSGSPSGRCVMPFMSDHGLPLGGTGLRRRAGLAGSQRGGAGLGRRRRGHAQVRLPRARPGTPSSTSSWPGHGKRTCRPSSRRRLK
jgi:hypothetical protein